MKAQIVGQIFVYILAVVLAAVILVFGYKVIIHFKEQADQIAYVEMKNEIVNSVKSITIDFGSVVKKEITVPSKYKEICFVKTYGGLPNVDDIDNSYPIIRESVSSGAKNNVFPISDTAENPFSVGDITLKDDGESFFCAKTLNNRIVLRLEGRGDHADISEWR